MNKTIAEIMNNCFEREKLFHKDELIHLTMGDFVAIMQALKEGAGLIQHADACADKDNSYDNWLRKYGFQKVTL